MPGWACLTIGLVLSVSGPGCAGPSSPGSTVADSRAPGPAPSPSRPPPSPPERPALDLWERFGVVEGHEVGRYDPLRAMVRWSHAIVRGTVMVVEGSPSGDDDPDLRNIETTLRVSESFKGPFRAGDAVPFVAGLTDRGNVAERFGDLAGDEGIFFLVESGAPRPEFGTSGLPVEERSGNWFPATSQAVAIDDGGIAVFAMNLVPHGFPATMDRIPIEELERRIREALPAKG